MNSLNEIEPFLSLSNARNTNSDISSKSSGGSGLNKSYNRTNSFLSNLPSGLFALNWSKIFFMSALGKPVWDVKNV